MRLWMVIGMENMYGNWIRFKRGSRFIIDLWIGFVDKVIRIRIANWIWTETKTNRLLVWLLILRSKITLEILYVLVDVCEVASKNISNT